MHAEGDLSDINFTRWSSLSFYVYVSMYVSIFFSDLKAEEQDFIYPWCMYDCEQARG
jgi:hypothetical protein